MSKQPARYCVGSPVNCPRCGGKLDPDGGMPLYDGTCENFIEICDNCYTLLHDRYERHRKAWIAAYWEDEFDTVVALHDKDN